MNGQTWFRQSWLALALLAWTAAAPVAHAVETGRSSLRPSVRPPCDEVCELQAQDGAFQLLVEVYRQFRGRQIQNQYEARRGAVSGEAGGSGSLVIATSLDGLNTVRDWLMLCIQVDRDRQLRELSTKVAQMRVAYACVRRADEGDIGQEVPQRIDEQAAGELLKQFDVIAFGSTVAGPPRLVKSVPATWFLYDAPRLDPDATRVAEPCADTTP